MQKKFWWGILLVFTMWACNIGVGTEGVDIDSFSPGSNDAGGVDDGGTPPLYEEREAGGFSGREDAAGGSSGASDAGRDSGAVKDASGPSGPKAAKVYTCNKTIPEFNRNSVGATNCSDAPDNNGIVVGLSYKLTVLDDGSMTAKADIIQQFRATTQNHYSDQVSYEAIDRGARDGRITFPGDICSGGEDRDQVIGAKGNWNFSIDFATAIAGVYYTDVDVQNNSWDTLIDCNLTIDP